MKVEGGVGKLTLDFGGALDATQKAEITLSMGELRLRLPKRSPVRITMDRFLSSFDSEGLVQRGGSWVTRDFNPAEPHLDIALDVQRRRGAGGVGKLTACRRSRRSAGRSAPPSRQG